VQIQLDAVQIPLDFAQRPFGPIFVSSHKVSYAKKRAKNGAGTMMKSNYLIKQKISKLTEEAASSANVTAKSGSDCFERESTFMIRNIRRFYAGSLGNNLSFDSGFVYDSARDVV
jgi:hypothetical protein